MYEKQDFSHLLGIPGFSDPLLADHFALYEGYVKNVNAIAERSAELEPGTPEYSELRRRLGWEWNGMRLHELYFSNLVKNRKSLDRTSPLAIAITEHFGSVDAWEEDFRTAAAMRGIGWVVLAKDGDKLFNVWVNEHDAGHLVGARPLLVMDVFEHAYIRDYGIKRADYIDAFMHSVNWDHVADRLS